MIKNIIDAIRTRIADVLSPSVATLIAAINTIEAALEKAIAKDTKQLQGLSDARDSIQADILSKNAEVDAAYKMLHNVSKVLA